MEVPRLSWHPGRMERAVQFDQDRLDAYNLGRGFTRAVEALLRRIPRGHSEQFDQLRRAALSTTLNTAEGAGEFTPREKARFYRIARRSGTEAAAVLDSFVDRGLLEERDIEPARLILHRLIGALTRLIQSVDPAWTSARARQQSTRPIDRAREEKRGHGKV
jgi:four helix bundle protein